MIGPTPLQDDGLRHAWLEKVMALGARVSRVTDLQGCLTSIYQSIRQGLEFDRVGITVYDAESDLLRGTLGTSRSGDIEDMGWFVEKLAGNALVQQILDDPSGYLYVPDYTAQRNLPPEHELYGVKEHVAVAARVGDALMAVIAADNFTTGRPMHLPQLEALRIFGGYAGLAIENARLYASLQRELAERRRADEEIRSLNAALERRDAERAVQLRESETLFRALFEHSPDGILLINPHATGVFWPLVDCNPTACQMNGYSRDELVGQSLEMLHPAPGTAAERFDFLARLRAAHVLTFEILHRRKDGTVFPVEASTSLVTLGGRELVLAIDRDITERKEAEVRLRQSEMTFRRHNSYLEALHDTTVALLSGLEISDLLDGILNRAARLLNTAYGFMYLLDADGVAMELKLDVGLAEMANAQRAKLGEGMVGVVWNTGQPLAIDDYDHWVGRAPHVGRGKFGAVMAAPLKSGGSVIGVLGLGHAAADSQVFGEAEVEIVTRFAHLASIALENAHLLETERAARRQAEMLQAATQALSASLDLKVVLELILTRLKEVVPYDSASVQELRGEVLEIIGGVGFVNINDILGIRYNLNTGRHPNAVVVRELRPLILKDTEFIRYPEFQTQVNELALAGIRSWLGVPMLFGDEAVGMITLDKREPGYYTKAHAEIALSFAAQAAIAINNARTYREVQDYASESSALYRAAGKLLNPGSDVVHLAEQIAAVVSHEFELLNCSVMLLNEAGTELRKVAEAGEFQKHVMLALPLDGSGLTVSAARSGEMIYVPDVTKDPRYLVGDPRTQTELVMPLRNQKRVIGVLDMQSPELDAFDARARRIVSAFAQHAELALENAFLVANLEQAYRKLRDDQEQLLAAEKMASLGRLTAGIAHEMNTPVAAVRSALAEIKSLASEYQEAIGDPEVTPDDHQAIARDIHRAAGLANTAAEQAAAFVRSVKSQTRDPGPADHSRFKVVPVIKDTLLLLGHALRLGRCQATFEYDSADHELLGSPGRLAQVVTNLVTNAIDASAAAGGGGIQVALQRNGAGFDLRVSDSGSGVPPELLTKIFEPMFTTKPFGQGTGLGLTIIHDIVTGDFHGNVQVSSPPGQGAVFSVHFPPAPEPEA